MYIKKNFYKIEIKNLITYPASHIVQFTALLPLTDPSEQSRQSVQLWFEYFPGMQFTQTLAPLILVAVPPSQKEQFGDLFDPLKEPGNG